MSNTLVTKIKRKVLRGGRKLGLYPARRFVLLCHQRSGSNMLTSIMNQHPQVIMRGQLFKDDPDYRKSLAKIGTASFQGSLFDDKIESRERFDRLEEDPAGREARNTEEVITSFYSGQERHSMAKSVGIKLHGGTLYRDELSQLLIQGNRYHFLLLHRENLLEAAISWYQARTLNRWVDKSDKKKALEPIAMEVTQLDWFVTRTQQDVALWKELLEANKRDYLELTYERITAPGYDYGPIWEKLGVPPVSNPAPKTNKLIKKYDHITNLEEIRTHFRGRQVGMV